MPLVPCRCLTLPALLPPVLSSRAFFPCRPEDYDRAKGKYIINADTMKLLQKEAVVMHPLPRVDEVGGGGSTL